MLLRYIDVLECPTCKATARLWKIQGDLTDTRMANGTITCPNDHSWNVTEDVLRMDKENSDEDMIFNDHPLTGFPKSITESDRGSFLIAFEEYIDNFIRNSDKTLVVKGNSILFFKYIPSVDRDIIVIHPDEGILRQIQELVAKKRMYDKLSCIRADNAALLGDFVYLNFFPDENELLNMKRGEKAFILDPEMPGEEIWAGINASLKIVTK